MEDNSNVKFQLKKIKWFSEYLKEVLSYDDKNHQTTLDSLSSLIDLYLENKNEPTSIYFDYYGWDHNFSSSEEPEQSDNESESSSTPPDYNDINQENYKDNQFSSLDPLNLYKNSDSESETSESETEEENDGSEILMYINSKKLNNYNAWSSNLNVISL
jgi:hypothetical protein